MYFIITDVHTGSSETYVTDRVRLSAHAGPMIYKIV